MASDVDRGVEPRFGDFHSHLIPGVDDGARSVEDTLEGVDRMVACGITRVITTPHFDASLTLSPVRLHERLSRIDAAWEEAVAATKTAFPTVDFRRGFEIKIDVPDADFSDRRLWLGGTRFMLMEWPRMRVPPSSPAVIQRIVEAGARPIVAHPERYSGLDSSLDIVAQWREAGAYLQLNYGSLVGRFGPRASETAFRLLELGWVDYLSSDFHGRAHLDLFHEEARSRLEELGFPEQFDLLAGTNPLRLFEDQEPVEVPPIVVERRLWDRIRGMLGS